MRRLDARRLGGVGIDNQIEPRRLLNRQIAGTDQLEDPVDVDGGAPGHSFRDRTRQDPGAFLQSRGPLADRKRGKQLRGTTEKFPVHHDKEMLSSWAAKCSSSVAHFSGMRHWILAKE